MSIAKNQKKLEKRKKNQHSCFNQLFAIFYSKNSTVSSSKRLNVWGSGGNSQKANERQFLREKEIIRTKCENQQRWKRRKNSKSIQLRTHHNIAYQTETLALLQSNKIHKTLTSLEVKAKQIRKGIHPLETLLRKNFKGCHGWKKQLAIFVYYFPMNFYISDPVTTIVDALAGEWDDKIALRRNIIDVMRRLKIVFEIKQHMITKHSSGFIKKKKEDILTFFFSTKNTKCINKDIVISNNIIINFKKNNYKDKQTKYFKYKIWQTIRSFDANPKEKRYKTNLLLHRGRNLIINPNYFEFANIYQRMLTRIQNENVPYSEIKKTIKVFSFLAEKYITWFLDNKKEDRAKHMMIYRLTKNPIVFNKK
jgi:hypothetical protein